MRTLPTTFRKNGFDYNQVERVGNVAIYRQTKAGQSWERFEVGRIRANAERKQFGTVFEASETWPTAEEWGVKAWTCTDLAGAKTRMATLIGSKPANLTPAQELA